MDTLDIGSVRPAVKPNEAVPVATGELNVRPAIILKIPNEDTMGLKLVGVQGAGPVVKKTTC